MTKLFTDEVAVLATIDPDAYTAAAYTSDWVDMSKWQRIACIVMAGTLGTSATLDAKLQAADDGSGTNPVDLTLKAITQLTQAGSDSDKQAIINLQDDEIQAQTTTAGKRYVAVVMTVGTATSDAGAIILGMGPRIGLAKDSDLASVDEIKV